MLVQRRISNSALLRIQESGRVGQDKAAKNWSEVFKRNDGGARERLGRWEEDGKVIYMFCSLDYFQLPKIQPRVQHPAKPKLNFLGC
jgi:hypothetical protein